MIVTAIVMLIIGAACFLGRVIAGPSLADRVVALDALVVVIVAIIVLNSIRLDTDRYIDVALVVSFVGFVGTTAAARFIERRGG